MNVELQVVEKFIKEKGFILLNTTSVSNKIVELAFSDLKEHSIQCRVTDKLSVQFSHTITKGSIRVESPEFGDMFYDNRFDKFYNWTKEVVEKIYKEDEND